MVYQCLELIFWCQRRRRDDVLVSGHFNSKASTGGRSDCFFYYSLILFRCPDLARIGREKGVL